MLNLSLCPLEGTGPCAYRASTGIVESWICNKDYFSTNSLILERRQQKAPLRTPWARSFPSRSISARFLLKTRCRGTTTAPLGRFSRTKRSSCLEKNETTKSPTTRPTDAIKRQESRSTAGRAGVHKSPHRRPPAADPAPPVLRKPANGGISEAGLQHPHRGCAAAARPALPRHGRRARPPARSELPHSSRRSLGSAAAGLRQGSGTAPARRSPHPGRTCPVVARSGAGRASERDGSGDGGRQWRSEGRTHWHTGASARPNHYRHLPGEEKQRSRGEAKKGSKKKSITHFST